MMRVWCPQKVSVRPDGSRMVVVARSLGWASHTIMGASCCRRGPVLAGGLLSGGPGLGCVPLWPGRVFSRRLLLWWWSYAEQVKQK